MSQEAIQAWIRIGRDVLFALIGAFILIHETITEGEPNYLLVGAGLAAFGLPPALRLDEKRRSEKSNDNVD